MEDLGQNPKDRFKFAALGLFFFGLFLLSVGAGVYFFRTKNTDSDIQIIDSSGSASQGEALRGKDIIVHIDGAVKVPGVYNLSSSARVKDAVEAAGGLSTEADTNRLNLASKLTDGQKISIPSLGEASGVSTGQGNQASSLININSAPETELDKLPGVGPATAKKIISSRPYNSLEDLTLKKAVSSAVFEKIKDLVTVY